MNYAVGVDDFKNIIKSSIYIDKTDIINKILSSPIGSSFLFCRPRRFGKSLALSMIDYYFDVSKKEEGLFNNLVIDNNLEATNLHKNKYNVIHLNFKDLMGHDYDSLIRGLKSKIRDIYLKFDFILEELNESMKSYYLNIVNKICDEQDLCESIYILCKLLKEKTNYNTILLIDEYDSPIIKAKENRYYEEAINFFKPFYSQSIKSNNYLSYTILTGVTQVAKESIFSDLNNLIVNNVFSREKEYFGFTEEEVKALLPLNNFEEVSEYYGGYYFGNNIVFNPWSLLNYLNNNYFDYYWTNTSENSIIKDFVESSENNDNILWSIYQLVTTGNYRNYVNQQVSFKDINPSEEDLLAILISTGYLTARQYSNIDDTCLIAIPNIEIKKVFYKEIIAKYMKNVNRNLAFELLEAIKKLDNDKIEEAINNYLLNAFTTYEMNNEKAYQVLVLTLCAIIFSDHLVKSEQNVGEGRCDIIVYPNKNDSIGIVIETKYYKSKVSQNVLNDLALKALKQIKNKNYISDLEKMNACPIYIYGFAFAKQKTKIVSEIIKKLA